MESFSISKTLQVAALFLVTIIIIFLRRPDQFLEPYVWVEDGTLHMRQFLEYGYLSLFVPVHGYILFPAKIINLLGIGISFYFYPEITLLLTLFFTVGVVLAIATAPTALHWRWLCALLVLLIPTNPECFGVSLYAFWWGSILLILSLLWNWKSKRPGVRVSFVLIGGFSSPLIIGLVPLFWYRAWIARQWTERRIAILVTGITVFQIIFLVQNPGTSKIPLTLGEFQDVVDKYFGFFLIHAIEPKDWLQALAGYFLLSIIVIGFYHALRAKQHSFILLNMTLCITIIMSAIRVSPEIVHPVLAGPRYFFYPYILMFWILTWRLAESVNLRTRIISAVLITIALLNGLASGFSSRHDHLDWRDYVDRCMAGETNRIPVHFAGDATNTWILEVSPEECQRLMKAGLFGQRREHAIEGSRIAF
jgi:hypothetical protein